MPEESGNSKDGRNVQTDDLEADSRWVWERLFDAMVYCCTKGFDWHTVYDWSVDEFTDVYHSLQRTEARSFLHNFSALLTAQNGDTKAIKAFIKNNSLWLPQQEKQGTGNKVDDFIAAMKTGKSAK